MNKPKLYFFVGLSGSGKSTIAKILKRTVSNNIEIYSSDAIRKELYGDENIQDNPQKVFRILHKRIKTQLKEGKSAIYDATNLNMKRRMSFLEEIKNIDCEKICVIVNTPFEVCVSQNNKRERVVPYSVLKRQRESFQCPYYYEGWDNICITNIDEDLSSLEDILEASRLISHDNPHHTLSIGKHMDKAFEYCSHRAAALSIMANDRNIDEMKKEEYFKEAEQWSEIALAAKFHDIGKIYTKSFLNSKGELCKIAHYYQHQNVSAYTILSHLSYSSNINYISCCSEEVELEKENIAFWLKIVVLVQWHMEHYFRKDKAWDKFESLVGKELVELLDKLHEADKAAH